jgi:hypothetical protein
MAAAHPSFAGLTWAGLGRYGAMLPSATPQTVGS